MLIPLGGAVARPGVPGDAVSLGGGRRLHAEGVTDSSLG